MSFRRERDLARSARVCGDIFSIGCRLKVPRGRKQLPLRWHTTFYIHLSYTVHDYPFVHRPRLLLHVTTFQFRHTPPPAYTRVRVTYRNPPTVQVHAKRGASQFHQAAVVPATRDTNIQHSHATPHPARATPHPERLRAHLPSPDFRQLLPRRASER